VSALTISQKTIRRFIRQERGAIAVMFALMLPVIMGFVGLAVEVGMWYAVKRNLQSAADAAAMSAAYEISANSTSAIRDAAALTDATRNDYDASIGNIIINSPPLSGSYTGNSSAVEVILSEVHTMMFASLISSSDVTIAARAVALSSGDGDACVLALNPSAQKSLEFSGNQSIDATGCIIASNSSHASSIEITGSASVTADSLSTVGNYTTQGASTLTTSSTPSTSATAITDPYSNLSIPTYSGCDQTEYKINPGNNATITPYSSTTPYVFCKGLDIKGTLTLEPGVYVIDRGTFNLNASGVLTGTDVSFILTSSTGGDYAKFDMNGGASIDITAATSGDYSGVLMYADRDGPDQDNKLNGNSSATFNGAMYFPSSSLEFEGNSSLGGTACTQLIANTIKLTGSTSITTSGCEAAGATLASTNGTSLVE